MISQTDIIKTLVNKNCTDESVLSTALSKDCTPTKLLERLTETERFDLALDISMKSGLDVIPLWRTWAMRCLKNRNFQGAREKFRHCFPRLRLPGYRVSPAQSGLLAEILKELARMDETQLNLSEQIELIKQGQASVTIGSRCDNLISRNSIYAECLYYMQQYGAAEDHIKFYVANNLWELAAKDLLNNLKKINIDRFFIGELVPYTIACGKLEQLIRALIDRDPCIADSSSYFEALYNFCQANRRYNLLHYIQSLVGDTIGAAETQINSFFLRKPIKNYRELGFRVTNLMNACQLYQDYLGGLDKTTQERPTLFRAISRDVALSQIRLINAQIDITRNFSINEVCGCINTIEIPPGDDESDAEADGDDYLDLPATLFDKVKKRKTFLAALVLIYFDLSCSTYFSKDGLELAVRLISDYSLDKIRVFKTAMRIIIEDESCDILAYVALLLERLKEDYVTSYNQQLQKKLLQDQKEKVRRSSKRKSTTRRLSSHQPNTGLQSKERTSTTRFIKLDEGSETPAHQFRENNVGDQVSTDRDCQHVSLPGGTLGSRGLNDDGARKICDEVLKDSIKSCREPDYKMELAKLLSDEARIELYIELGMLSYAQRLAFSMNRPDYVSKIIEQATKLNQSHIKTVCQLWLAKHETDRGPG